MVSPEIWGKHGWQFLHYVSIGYPENPTPQDKQKYKDFFLSVGHILPCAKCQRNYYRHLEDFPLTDVILSNKENFVKWVVAIHNTVNMENGKDVLSMEQAQILIKNDTCSDDLNDIVEDERKLQLSNPPKMIEGFTNSSNDHYYLMIVVFIAVVIFIISKYYKN